ncbi:MAG: DUF4157 domain-containing protein, partial [Planctomycetota bacterium]
MQAKLVVGEIDDAYEREADRFAAALVASGPASSGPHPTLPSVQRAPLTNADASGLERRPFDQESGGEELAAPEEDDEQVLRTKRDQSVVPQVTESFARELHATRRGGAGLASSERRFFEPRLGRGLGHVRLHADERAAALAGRIQARAFTRGSDIYFGAGQFRPAHPEGRRLLAHELVHTVQQAPGAPLGHPVAGPPAPAGPGLLQRDVLQRQRDGSAPSATVPGQAPAATVDATTLDPSVGRLDPQSETIAFDEVAIPDFKLEEHRKALYGRPLRQTKNYKRGDTRQRDIWVGQLAPKAHAIRAELIRRVQQAHRSNSIEGVTHYFKAPSPYDSAANKRRYFIGGLDAIASELVLPSWSSSGAGHSYDVDHVVELQLANWPTETWGNELQNMELLDSIMNRSSGSTIQHGIDAKVRAFVRATHGAYGKSTAEVKKHFELSFARAVPDGGATKATSGEDFWTKEQILAGQHLGAVEIADPTELGVEGELKVFPRPSGGRATTLHVPLRADDRRFLAPFVLTQLTPGADPKTLATLELAIPDDHKEWLPAQTSVTVSRFPGARFAGFIDREAVRAKLRTLKHKRASPIEIGDFEVEKEGIELGGRILPDVSLLRGSEIEFGLRGDGLEVAVEFVADDIHVPEPLRVEQASLRLSASTQSGLSALGRVDFGVIGLGRGYLEALASTSSAFNLAGKFAFDTRLFDPAEVEVKYVDGALSLGGRIGISAGNVPGIRSAVIEAAFDGSTNSFHAQGTVQPSIKGLGPGTLALGYSTEAGMTLGGTLALADGLPGVKSGNVEMGLREVPEEDRWELSARGKAVGGVPGAELELAVSYDDGAFMLEGAGAYKRGLLDGQLRFGVSNRELDAQGVPTGPPGELIRAYGGGEMSLRIAPWLTASAGVRVLPNGEVEIAGGVRLPAALDLFPEKRHDKNLLSIGLDIPIVGVAVAGQRIGIFATISGGVSLEASVGPGQLRGLGLELLYNPAHEERTTIRGAARLNIPARAGVRLFASGGIGAGIPVVCASASLEVGGRLGLEGAIDADALAAAAKHASKLMALSRERIADELRK